MVIAYISYEHPESISGGGIGTYIGQLSKLMALRGHHVEVFSGTFDTINSHLNIDGYQLNLIFAETKEDFRKNVLSVFEVRHQLVSFEIMESPEFGADALYIKKAYPKLPLTLKLHTPSFLVEELNAFNRSWKDKLRFTVGGLLRGKMSKPYWRYRKNDDLEYELFNLAETISSPSKSLAKIVGKRWNNKKIVSILPLPFEVSDELKKIKYPELSSQGITVTFIGKLEKRKGILDLMNAVPQILRLFPTIRFRFVGKGSFSPNPKLDMISYIKTKLHIYEDSLEFLGFQDYDRLPIILEESHICIFPSHWENFPNVCLEAMAARRLVIGTNNGGMADMIINNTNGILIPPNSPKAIFKAVIGLVRNLNELENLRDSAQKTILSNYNGLLIGDLTENLYKKTITFYE